MPKKQLHIRASERLQHHLAALTTGGATVTEVVTIAVDRMYREEHPMWKYVDDKYGADPFTVKSVEEFKRMCADAELDIELTWRTDGDRDYYVDQHGDVVLEQVVAAQVRQETGE